MDPTRTSSGALCASRPSQAIWASEIFALISSAKIAYTNLRLHFGRQTDDDDDDEDARLFAVSLFNSSGGLSGVGVAASSAAAAPKTARRVESSQVGQSQVERRR